MAGFRIRYERIRQKDEVELKSGLPMHKSTFGATYWRAVGNLFGFCLLSGEMKMQG